MPVVCSSRFCAPEGAMLPFAPQEEPWDHDMEVFGGGANSCEVSVVAKGGSHPHPSLQTLAGTPERRGVGLGAGRPSKPSAGCRMVQQALSQLSLPSEQAGTSWRAQLWGGCLSRRLLWSCD